MYNDELRINTERCNGLSCVKEPVVTVNSTRVERNEIIKHKGIFGDIFLYNCEYILTLHPRWTPITIGGIK